MAAFCKFSTATFVFYLIAFLFLARDVAPREISNYTKNIAPGEIAGVAVHEHDGEIANNGSDIRRSLRGLLQHGSPGDGQGEGNSAGNYDFNKINKKPAAVVDVSLYLYLKSTTEK